MPNSRSVVEYSLRCTTENAWKKVLVHAGDPSPTTCPTDSAHTVDTSRTKIVGKTLDLVRVHEEDGSLVVKVDPGTPDTDPKFRAQPKATVTQAESPKAIDADFTATGKRFAGIRVMCKDAFAGDTIAGQAVSDGTDEATYGPAGTVILDFGGINVHVVAPGEWDDPEIFPPPSVATSKLIPPGLKLRIVYTTTADAGTREILHDWIMQE